MFFKLLAWLGSNTFLKVFRGIAGPILDHYKSKDIQVTQRQGLWAGALINAAQADVKNRELAQAERANNPWMMFVYFLILIGPVLYYFMFWMDTIFADQVWAINLYFFEINIWNWKEYELTRAPARLEDMGKWIIGIFIGGGAAVAGVVKGAKVLSAAGIFKGK